MLYNDPTTCYNYSLRSNRLQRKQRRVQRFIEVSPSDDWFLYEYIDPEVNNKLDKTKQQLTGDEIETKTKYYMVSLNHDPNWLNNITIEIDKFLNNRESINFFMQMYMQHRERLRFYLILPNIDHSTSNSF